MEDLRLNEWRLFRWEGTSVRGESVLSLTVAGSGGGGGVTSSRRSVLNLLTEGTHDAAVVDYKRGMSDANINREKQGSTKTG